MAKQESIAAAKQSEKQWGFSDDDRLYERPRRLVAQESTERPTRFYGKAIALIDSDTQERIYWHQLKNDDTDWLLSRINKGLIRPADSPRKSLTIAVIIVSANASTKGVLSIPGTVGKSIKLQSSPDVHAIGEIKRQALDAIREAQPFPTPTYNEISIPRVEDGKVRVWCNTFDMKAEPTRTIALTSDNLRSFGDECYSEGLDALGRYFGIALGRNPTAKEVAEALDGMKSREQSVVLDKSFELMESSPPLRKKFATRLATLAAQDNQDKAKIVQSLVSPAPEQAQAVKTLMQTGQLLPVGVLDELVKEAEGVQFVDYASTRVFFVRVKTLVASSEGLFTCEGEALSSFTLKEPSNSVAQYAFTTPTRKKAEKPPLTDTAFPRLGVAKNL